MAHKLIGPIIIGDLAAQRFGAVNIYLSPAARLAGRLLTPQIRKKVSYVVPDAVKNGAKKVLSKRMDDRFRQVAESQKAVDFIKSFYAEDIKVHCSICGNVSKT